MKVSNVVAKKYVKGNLRGFADISFDECLTVYGWKIWNRKDGSGLFVAPPTKMNDAPEDKKYNNIAYVTDKDFDQELQDVVIKAYNSLDQDDSVPDRPSREVNTGFNNSVGNGEDIDEPPL